MAVSPMAAGDRMVRPVVRHTSIVDSIPRSERSPRAAWSLVCVDRVREPIIASSCRCHCCYQGVTAECRLPA